MAADEHIRQVQKIVIKDAGHQWKTTLCWLLQTLEARCSLQKVFDREGAEKPANNVQYQKLLQFH